jgi:hypothetical protein
LEIIKHDIRRTVSEVVFNKPFLMESQLEILLRTVDAEVLESVFLQAYTIKKTKEMKKVFFILLRNVINKN